MESAFFLDSSAIFVLTDRDDEYGPLVEDFLRGHKSPLVTTDFIFAESISLMTKRLGKKVAEQAGDHLLDSRFVEMIFLDEKTQQEAWALFKKYKDKDFDFIDATSFVVCRQRGIKEVITLDRHFAQMGFKVHP